MGGIDVESEIDGLYRLPLGDFTEARNALARRLKERGETERSAEVRALGKPGLAAWAVNQSYWSRKDAFEQLLRSGAELRASQGRSTGSGGAEELRGARKARRECVVALTDTSRATLEAGGHAATPATLRRVEATLEALATYGEAPAPARLGRLTRDLEPPGFDFLMQLAGQRATGRKRRPRKPSAARADPARERRIEQARTVLARAERAAERRRAATVRAETACAAVRERAAELSDALEQAERKLHKARFRVKEAADKLRRATGGVEQARAAEQRAEAAVAAARKKLRRFESG